MYFQKIGIAITNIPKSPEKFSYFFFHFPTRKIRGLRCFFIKFKGNIDNIRGEAENISILPENLMKKHRNPHIFLIGK